MKGMSKLAESLEKMIDQYDLKGPLDQSKTLELWDEVVGEKLASKTHPEKIEHGKLIVKVDSPTWRNELQFHKEQIKKDLNTRIGKKIVKQIVFV
ncbi:MAG: DUF721 domain-containing protein [Candidatus Marinimicrobia bacterium]|nr:DUF721 domain-containing protein [Candidatus Neomarinimicrobiota bacterium]MCF7829128.1 DUF721 domain-containing protein [Candidatus Neomarinimicrobiota bacterium]MCF7881473.1 DUF721 domain-containing protein [Candidatus Neomarinimicrobiota bacterium]